VQRSTLWVFFLSGVAALIYQIVWQRLLVFFSGTDVYSSTLVVAAFMAGLGVGHLAGGHLADRSSRRTNLLLFAIAELAIAAFSLLSRPLYYDLLYVRLGPRAIPAPAMAGVLFASLLWPTFFMGVSLPLLARSFTENVERAASRVGALYGINTLGAAAGALITTWLLLPHLGLEGSVWIGAALNATCAVLVFRLLPGRESSASPDIAPGDRIAADDVPPHPETRVKSPAFAVWALVYGLSGFLALSLEIVWFRLLGVIVKSTAYTFGTLLAIYLAGVGLGSLAGMRYAGKFRRPAPLFLMLQASIGLSAALLFAGFVGLVEDLSWLRGYFAGYEPLDVLGNLRRLRLRDLVEGRMVTEPGRTLPWEAVVLYFLVPASLIALPTFLMGFSFPVLQRVVQSDLTRLGRRVGLLLVANIVGSVAGTLLTGWVALNVLGVAGTMKALAVISGAFAVAAAWHVSSVGSWTVHRVWTARVVLAGGAAAVIALAAVRVPGAATLWARLHGTRIDRIVFAEDATVCPLSASKPPPRL
jgi:predicted membrane-bound spermidine synthase